MNIKIRLTTILTLSFLLLFLFACEPKEEVITEPSYTFELVGEYEVSIEFGLEYTDAGVIALDWEDNSLEYTTTCDIDTAVVMTYTCEYSLIDYEHILVRTINVVDLEAPIMLRDTLKVRLGSTPINFSEINFIVDDNYNDSITVEVIEDNINYDVIGEYDVTIKLTDESGNEALYIVNVLVSEMNTTGLYDLRYLDVDSKSYLFAALESYLIDTVTGGVPLYRSAARVMFSERTQLFSETYNGVMAFGAPFSQFTADDSTVLMYDDVYGNPGEYTWRCSFNTDPQVLNPWEADDRATSEFVELFTGGLYDFYFDDSKTGYEINGSLADGEPVAVNGTEQNGTVYSYVWQIPVKDGLTWTYHPDTDVSGLPAGHEVLDANDYLWTWQHALDNNWFRAISGGGDFITHGVKGVSDYLAGSVDFSEVGLRMADGETNVLEIEFTTERTAFDIKYMFTNSLTPINEELFTALGGETGSYGLTPEEVASSGVYYFDTWTPGQFLTFKKNDSHPDSAMFHYTGYQYRFVDGSDSIFAEFLAGRLDTAAVPASQVDAYGQDPRVKVSPGATTWRLQINGFGTEANRDAFIAQYPEFGLSETFVPEPILGYTEMKQALYYGIDREHLTVEVGHTYLPATTYFSSSYFLDNQSGMTFRGSEAGQAVYNEFTGDDYGFNETQARTLFRSAVEQAIADGHYTAGTEENPTVIEITLTFRTHGNTYLEAMRLEIERQYEEILYDDVNHVRIDIVHEDIPVYYGYYHPIMTASTDLAVSGISGNLLCPIDFFDVYRDDNKSGFTINWGIDTSTANIEVEYVDMNGVLVNELWSFNALSSALNGPIYVENGIEVDEWDYAYDVIEGDLIMNEDTLVSYKDGNNLSSYIYPDLETIIGEDASIDSFESYIVTTGSNLEILYVFSVYQGVYKLYDTNMLFTDVFDAIEKHADYDLVSVDGQITDDTGVRADAYLAGLGITTYANLILEAGIVPDEIVQAYAVTWGGGYGGSDVYLVLFIDGYYIGWEWL